MKELTFSTVVFMKMGNPKLPTKLLSACNQERENRQTWSFGQPPPPYCPRGLCMPPNNNFHIIDYRIFFLHISHYTAQEKIRLSLNTNFTGY